MCFHAYLAWQSDPFFSSMIKETLLSRLKHGLSTLLCRKTSIHLYDVVLLSADLLVNVSLYFSYSASNKGQSDL